MNNFPTLLPNGLLGFNFNEPMPIATDLSTKVSNSSSTTTNSTNNSINVASNISEMENLKSESDNLTSFKVNSNNGNSFHQTHRTKSIKSGNKKSFVWKYFKHPQNTDGIEDRTRTECLECKSQLAFNASGTTTTMLNHLKSRHPKIAESEECTKKAIKNTMVNNSNAQQQPEQASEMNLSMVKKEDHLNISSSNNNITNTNNEGDSPNDSFLSIDMSKTSNPSPNEFKPNSTHDMNIWPILQTKPEALETATNQYVYLQNPLLRSIVMTTTHRQPTTTAQSSIQMAPIALTTALNPTNLHNLSTTSSNIISDINNNNGIKATTQSSISLFNNITNCSNSIANSVQNSLNNGSIDFSMTNTSNSNQNNNENNRNIDTTQHPLSLQLNDESHNDQNTTNKSSSNINASAPTKRKRKNISVNRLNVNNGGVQFQKKLKMDQQHESYPNINTSTPDYCNDLASIQSIHACSSISNMLNNGTFLSNTELCDTNNNRSSNNNNAHFNNSATNFINNNANNTTNNSNNNPSAMAAFNIFSTLNNNYNNGNIKNKYLTSADNILAYWLVKDLRPYSVLEELGTKTMFSLLMPSVTIPTISHINSSVIPTLYSCLKSEILSQFNPVNGCAFSIELWDSVHSTSSMYASLKLHYYNQLDNKLYCKMWKSQEINAKYLCSDLLISCCNELHMDLTNNTSDSSISSISNNKNFLPVVMNRPESLQDELANVGIIEQNKQFTIIPCLISSLQEVAQVGFQEPEVIMFLEKCRELKELCLGYNLELDNNTSNHTNTNISSPCPDQTQDNITNNSSSNGNNISPSNHHITHNNSNSNHNNHSTPNSSSASSTAGSSSSNTHAHQDWRNSRYICDKFQLIYWVHSNLDYIDEKLDGFNTHRFSKEDVAFLRQLMPLLEHIYQTLSVIEQNKLFFSASMIKSIIQTMNSKSPFQQQQTQHARSANNDTPNSSASEHPGVTQFKKAVKIRLDQIYPSQGDLHEVLWVATLLDPRFKKYHEFSPKEKEMLQKIKNQLLTAEPAKSFESTNDSINPQSLEASAPITSPLAGTGPGSSSSNNQSASATVINPNSTQDLHFMFGDDCVSSQPVSELDQYLTEHKIEIERNPIDWWLTNSSRYPKLTPIALKYLCIPLSNQNGPYIMSQSSKLLTRRKELSPEDIDYYLFLNHNWN